MLKYIDLKQELQDRSDKKQAKVLERFFKTGKGEYGEGDVFLGIKVPVLRKIAQKYKDFNSGELAKLLDSKIHEERFIALIILIKQYEKGNKKVKNNLYDFYLKHAKQVNNWDLVDLSAPKVVGDYLLNKPRKVLSQLAKSENLWEKRIAIIATFAFIRKDEFEDTLKVAEILLEDRHDLIHKAVGWMLREIGKRNQMVEEEFLKKHASKMPRIMLSYAIEKFDTKKKKFYRQR